MSFSTSPLSAPKPPARRTRASLTLTLALGLFGLPTVHAAPDDVTRLGLFDAEHTGPGGLQISDAGAVSGHWVGGTSNSFRAPERWGQSAWIGRPGAGTVRVGLYDTLHTSAAGSRVSWLNFINSRGVGVGGSVRYGDQADASYGASTWIADRWGHTVKIGFYDLEHTLPGGRKESWAVDLNERNQAIGMSVRAIEEGRSAWLADSTGRIVRLGFVDAMHTGAKGERFSIARALNDAGVVVGYSIVFQGSTWLGSTSWLRHPGGVMRRIGFVDHVHRSPQGHFWGEPLHLTDSGFIAGVSTRFTADSERPAGSTSWVTHIHGPNRPVGFYTGRHIRTTGEANSVILDLNDCGISAGRSAQYHRLDQPDEVPDGSTAWIAKPDGTTVRVGLYDAAHTANMLQNNRPLALNDADAAAGIASRFTPEGDVLGMSAWVANVRGQTTDISLKGEDYVDANGYRMSQPRQIEGNWVAGISHLYTSRAPNTQSYVAWIYDRVRKQHVLFRFPAPPDAQHDSRITVLRPDGSAAGLYRKYGDDGEYLGTYGFIYSPATGLIDLSAAYETELAQLGFDYLGEPAGMPDFGFVVVRANDRPGAPAEPASQAVLVLE